ncbi:ATP-binding cassette domain-containing protein [Vibrio sp. WXL210]|uniref:ATP-binding cassette domain-containing protein n=1 Tax=Vibrio sp. WXL210 TaxID=3450709 RepID=UPI003EC6F41E
MITVKDIAIDHRLLPTSFQIEAGEVVHLVGPNGSGKSSLIAALAGELVYKGEVYLQGRLFERQANEQQASIRSYLAQSGRPAFNVPVYKYLDVSVPKWVDKHDDCFKRTFTMLIELFALTTKLRKSVHQLSGGEWQRVRIVATCLQIWPDYNPHAQFALLDEPSAALDVSFEGKLHQLIRQLADKGLAVIVANHDLNRTLRHADKVMMLDQGVMRGFGPVADTLLAHRVEAIYQTPVTLGCVNGQALFVFD